MFFTGFHMSWRNIVYLATVMSSKGICHAGHEVGDTFELNTHKTGGICGFCYHDMFPMLMTLVMGGQVPWVEDPNEFIYECPDKLNLVTFKMVKREKG